MRRNAPARIPVASITRYLAEGATGSFFATRVAIANPGGAAHVLFRFQTSRRGARHVVARCRRRRGPRSTVDAVAGLASANISTSLESDVGGVVDRTMRWSVSAAAGAHAETRRRRGRRRWYLAEGATHGSFDLFYLLQNPSLTRRRRRDPLPAAVRPADRPDLQRRRRTAASPLVDRAARAGRHRRLGGDRPASTACRSSSSARCTRRPPAFAAGHDSAGVTARRLDWFFAEGATGGFFDHVPAARQPERHRRRTSRRPTCCRRGDGAEGLRRAGQQPSHAQRAARGSARWPTPRCR